MCARTSKTQGVEERRCGERSASVKKPRFCDRVQRCALALRAARKPQRCFEALGARTDALLGPRCLGKTGTDVALATSRQIKKCVQRNAVRKRTTATPLNAPPCLRGQESARHHAAAASQGTAVLLRVAMAERFASAHAQGIRPPQISQRPILRIYSEISTLT
ncbi:hypothetical protein ERJ75_001216200 [Trypanosoma vivax]|nr:hypothetical protein ERJ75_001216200 [Trypanosoma vivax]